MSNNIKIRVDLGEYADGEANRAAWERATAAQVSRFMDAAAPGVAYDIEFTELEDQDAPARVEAHFLPVAPPMPVATEPVSLDAAVARELAYLDAGHGFEGWTVAENEQTGSGRWESHHELVICNEAGEHFVGHYSTGLTEYQDTGPWEGEQSARFEPVQRRAKVVQVVEWVAVQAAQVIGGTDGS